MIENILDSLGNIIGTIELPDDSTPEFVQSQLDLYAYVPLRLTSLTIVLNSVAAASDFGAKLIMQYAAQNVLAGITLAGKTIAVATYLQQLGYYLNSGSLYAAITEIQTLIADSGSTKASLSPFITNDILYTYLNDIQSYLGVAPTPNPGS